MSAAGILEPAMVSLRFEALLSARRPEDALQLVQSQLPHHRDAAFIWALLCRGFLVLKRYSEAEGAGRQALALNPESTSLLVNLGLALLHQGNHEEAESMARRAVELEPEDPENHYWLGMIQLNSSSQGKPGWTAALQSARTALDLNPDNADFHWLAASASGRLGSREDAVRHLSEGLAADPGNRELLMLGTKIIGGDTVVGAETEVLRSLLAQDPMDSKAHLLLRGQTYAHLRRLAIRPWLQVVFFCFLAPFAPAAALGGAVPVALLLAFLFAWRSRRTCRRLRNKLPEGYLEDLGAGRLTRLSRRLTRAGMVAVSAGTLGAAAAGTGELLQWGLVLTIAGLLPAAAGYQLLISGEERDGQPPGSRYRRPDNRRSNATVILVGSVFSVLTLVHVDRLVFAGAALLALALMLAGAVLGVRNRSVITAVSGRLLGLGAAALLAVAILSVSGACLLQNGGQPQVPDSEPNRVPLRIPGPDFTYTPKPLPVITVPPITLPGSP